MNRKKIVVHYLILSTIGAALMILVAWLSSSNVNTIHIFDKLFVGGAFISSCIFGISLAFKPNWLKRFMKRSPSLKRQPAQTTNRARLGHHPDCEHFKDHTVRMKNKVLCAGCLGLASGSIASIFLTSIYIAFADEIPPNILLILIILGMIIIALNYIEIVISMTNALLHIISNIFLVIGFFFVIIGVFQLTGRVIYGMFGMIMSFLWLDTRIQLSNWHHSEVCENCSETCKAY